MAKAKKNVKFKDERWNSLTQEEKEKNFGMTGMMTGMMKMGAGMAQLKSGQMQEARLKGDYRSISPRVVGGVQEMQEGLPSEIEAEAEERIERGEAEAYTALLKSGDTRAMIGGAPNVLAQAQAAEKELVSAEAQAKHDALASLSAEQQRVYQEKMDKWEADMNYARALIGAGTQNAMQGGTEIIEGIGGMAGGMGGGMGMGAHGMNIPEQEIPKQEAPMININIGSGSAIEGKEEKKEEIEKKGDIEVTPGEFNHDTNPIDLVQDGEKVGEVTGGEVVINPRDTKIIEELASKGDKDNLIKFISELFARFKSDEENYAQEGGDVSGGIDIGVEDAAAVGGSDDEDGDDLIKKLMSMIGGGGGNGNGDKGPVTGPEHGAAQIFQESGKVKETEIETETFLSKQSKKYNLPFLT
jgi:hypothetical protein